MRTVKIAIITMLIVLFVPFIALAGGNHNSRNHQYGSYGNYNNSHYNNSNGCYHYPIVANSPSMPFYSGYVNYNPFAPGRAYFQPSNPFPRENYYSGYYYGY